MEHEKDEWLPEFAKPLAMEQSFATCTITDVCERPKCADLDDGPGAGWKYAIVVSAVYLNIFFVDIN